MSSKEPLDMSQAGKKSDERVMDIGTADLDVAQEEYLNQELEEGIESSVPKPKFKDNLDLLSILKAQILECKTLKEFADMSAEHELLLTEIENLDSLLKKYNISVCLVKLR